MSFFKTVVRKYLILWLVLIPGILCVGKTTAAFKYIHEGMEIPVVAGENVIDGSKISSEEYIKDNNMLIVVFWATWAKRSLQELEDLKTMSSEMGDLPVKIIAVNVEGENWTSATEELVKGKITEMDLPFPVILDKTLEIFYSFGVIAVPSTAIVDTTGAIRYGPAGYSLTTRDLIEDSIKVLLGLKQPETGTIAKVGYKPNNKSSRYYKLAMNLNNQRMYERALSNVELSIEADPKFPSAHCLKGDIFLSLDSLNDAITSYRTAVELDSLLVAALSGLGRAYLKNDNLDSALLYLQKTLKADDSYTPAFLDLGLTLSKMGRDEEALDSLRNAQELNMKDPLPHYYMGQVYLKSKDTANATESFKAALELLFDR